MLADKLIEGIPSKWSIFWVQLPHIGKVWKWKCLFFLGEKLMLTFIFNTPLNNSYKKLFRKTSKPNIPIGTF